MSEENTNNLPIVETSGNFRTVALQTPYKSNFSYAPYGSMADLQPERYTSIGNGILSGFIFAVNLSPIGCLQSVCK